MTMLDEPPPYLFRTLDIFSSGYTDNNITLSPAAVRKLPHHDRDVFALEPNFVMAVLERHVNSWRKRNKPLEPEQNIDNSMSWPTSLLYVVQCADHRHRLHGCSEDQIEIIAVDTSLFPPRMFLRASKVLQAHFRGVKKGGMRDAIDTRLCGCINAFGDFLSQETLEHHGDCSKVNWPTSHVTSLPTFRQKWALYTITHPELDNPCGQTKWALTTVIVRKIWHGDEYGAVSRWRTTHE